VRVKATREGLIGQRTASGWKINAVVPFVALPSGLALRQWVQVTNPQNGKSIRALVLDVGPWNTTDEAYVFNGARPQAESGVDLTGRPTNGAGIDLGERVWAALGMTDNDEVEWSFV
jgi:hypothetical protein